MPQDASSDPMIGRVLDRRYRVEARVARGGMAVVYEATDLRLDRTVAVKVLHEGLGDDPDFVGRFEREARHAARLSHPNVVAVFDQGEDLQAGMLFLVMEYVPGSTLRDLIRKEAPMAPGKALTLLEPVLSALATAHGAGMIHRDVKPENVLLADDGRIKVADFGLARAVGAETSHTATGGVLIGTVSYLAPELVVEGGADARADVYAAGVLLYEMLTGEKPHQADSPIQVAYKHVHEDIPPPSRRVRGIPDYVDALVARATARDRSLRPADARVLLQQVRRVRIALDQGATGDEELTQDLTPAMIAAHPALTTTATGAREIDPAAERLAVDEVFDQDAEQTPRVAAPLVPGPRRDAPPSPPLGPADPTAFEDDYGDLGGRPARRRRRLLPVLLVLAVVVAGAAWWLGVARYTETPGVLDLSQAAATTKLHHDGLHLRVSDSAYSETVPRGDVISTDPKPGSRILKHGTVAAVISLGPERHDVPRLAGKTLAAAKTALTDAHLTLGDDNGRWSETVAKGLVISSQPTVGTPLRRGMAVDVVVSKGPKPIDIPDYTGKSLTSAQKKLAKLGFDVDSSHTEHSNTVAKGDIISQSPDDGTGHKGDTITLIVSEGPVMVQVPNVRGSGLAEATSTLKADGFHVKVHKTEFYSGLQFVVQESPRGDTLQPYGSTIVLGIV